MDRPSCSGCSQREREIDELKKRVAELEKRLDDKERAGKRQAAPFSKGEPTPTPKKPGRKAGTKHGQHGHRPPPPPETIDETLEAPLPDACPHCGGDIAEDDDVDEQFQIDIPTKPVRRKFRIHKGCCKNCRRRVRGRHPLQTSDAVGAAQSQVGPNAQASIVYLNKRSGMSYGKIVDHLKEANGIDIKPSTATRIVLRTADKLQPVYQEIKESIKNSPFITPDETGWRKGGRLVWLHAWVGDQATCYVIDPRRSADALEKVVNGAFETEPFSRVEGEPSGVARRGGPGVERWTSGRVMMLRRCRGRGACGRICLSTSQSSHRPPPDPKEPSPAARRRGKSPRTRSRCW